MKKLLFDIRFYMRAVSFILQLSQEKFTRDPPEEDDKSMSSKHSMQYLDQPKLSKRTASAISVLTATMEGTSLKKLHESLLTAN